MKQKAAHSLPFVELVVVTLAVGASTARSAWLPAAALLAALLWATRWGLTRRVGVALPVHLPVAVLLLLAVATWWVTPDRSITGPQMARLALGVAWGYALIAWAAHSRRKSAWRHNVERSVTAAVYAARSCRNRIGRRC